MFLVHEGPDASRASFSIFVGFVCGQSHGDRLNSSDHTAIIYKEQGSKD